MRILFIFLFINFSLKSYSNDSLTFSRLGIGLKQGIGYNFLYYDYSPTSQLSGTISLLNPSVYMEYRFNKHLSISPEVQYFSKGFSESNNNATANYSLNFIGVNVNGKFRMGDDEEKNFLYLFGGPSIGYYLNGKITGNGINNYLEIQKDKINTVTISTALGMGYSRKFKSLEYSADIKAHMNNMPINKFGNIDIMLNQFSFNIGVLYYIN